jgi:hypothetical protein
MSLNHGKQSAVDFAERVRENLSIWVHWACGLIRHFLSTSAVRKFMPPMKA